ncbi:MAG: hypothetical protein Q4A11_04500 [Brachymonas sp.]|nr:hypothetical protein [Brachymonas sp.]
MYLISSQGLVTRVTSVRFFLRFAAFLPHVLSFVAGLGRFFAAVSQQQGKCPDLRQCLCRIVVLQKNRSARPRPEHKRFEQNSNKESTAPYLPSHSRRLAALKRRSMAWCAKRKPGPTLKRPAPQPKRCGPIANCPRKTCAGNLVPAINDGLECFRGVY